MLKIIIVTSIKNTYIGDTSADAHIINEYSILRYSTISSIDSRLSQIQDMLNYGLINKNQAKKLLGFK